MTNSSQSSKNGLYILFVRHGETQDNIDRILQGHRDTSLTEKGLEEAEVIAEKLKGQRIDVVYHSPLIRIVQTIRPFLKDFPANQIHPDKDLLGQGLGTLEGGSYDHVDMSNPRSADGTPGVELFDDFVTRVMRSFGRIVATECAHFSQGQQRRTVIIATHGVAITSLINTLEKRGLTVRGPDAYAVRWPDSDDIATLIVERPQNLPISDSDLQWSAIQGKPFLIEYWGKKEKRIDS